MFVNQTAKEIYVVLMDVVAHVGCVMRVFLVLLANVSVSPVVALDNADRMDVVGYVVFVIQVFLFVMTTVFVLQFVSPNVMVDNAGLTVVELPVGAAQQDTTVTTLESVLILVFPIVRATTVEMTDVVGHVEPVNLVSCVTHSEDAKHYVFRTVLEEPAVQMDVGDYVGSVILASTVIMQPDSVTTLVEMEDVILRSKMPACARVIVLDVVTSFVTQQKRSLHVPLIVPIFVAIVFVKLVKLPIHVRLIVLTSAETDCVKLLQKRMSNLVLMIVLVSVEIRSVKSVNLSHHAPLIVVIFVVMDCVKQENLSTIAGLIAAVFVEMDSARSVKPLPTVFKIVPVLVVMDSVILHARPGALVHRIVPTAVTEFVTQSKTWPTVHKIVLDFVGTVVVKLEKLFFLVLRIVPTFVVMDCVRRPGKH